MGCPFVVANIYRVSKGVDNHGETSLVLDQEKSQASAGTLQAGSLRGEMHSGIPRLFAERRRPDRPVPMPYQVDSVSERLRGCLIAQRGQKVASALNVVSFPPGTLGCLILGGRRRTPFVFLLHLEKNEMDATLKSVYLRAVGLLLTTSSSCVSTFNGPAPAADLRPPAVVQGRLIDDTSGKAIADAIVEWSVGGRKSETSTDSNGAFSFSIPAGVTREVVLSTTANLYRSEQRSVEIGPEQTTRVRIGLRSRSQQEIGVVRGTLKDAHTGRGIPDVVESIRGAGGRLSTTTGSDGSFNVERVGFNPTLRIEVTTPDPPCISPIGTSTRRR